jgi:hypothetical protein
MGYNLAYLATPTFGGWVTMTAHLSLKYNYPLFKISKSNRTEKNQRNFGYGVQYQNVSIDDLIQRGNILIVALDKHFYQYLDKFPDDTTIVMHDPNDFKSEPVQQFLKRVNVITIREAVKQNLLINHNIQSEFKYHPFHQYDPKTYKNNVNDKCISINRIDFDKNTHDILRANPLIKDDCNKIWIYGKENRLYVQFTLIKLGLKEEFMKYWRGRFDKTLPISFNERDILNNCKYVVDLSVIKGDGGGTQYTFLEAIHQDCILILHKEWVERGDLFKDKYNCYVVGYTDCIEQELADIINSENLDLDKKILMNSKQIMENNINVVW